MDNTHLRHERIHSAAGKAVQERFARQSTNYRNHQETVMPADFTALDDGSVIVLNALTDDAKEWVRDNIPADALSWGRGTVIEPRYWAPIENGIAEAGLTLIVH